MTSNEFNLFKFFLFLKTNFNFIDRINTFLLDGRKHPSVPLFKVAASIISMPFFKINSILQLDLFLKEPFTKALFCSSHRPDVISDSALFNALNKSYQQNPQTFGGLSDLIYDLLLDYPSKTTLYKSLRMGIIDGTSFSKHLGAALLIPGDIPFLADIEYMSKNGKELPSAINLAYKFTEKLGKNFFDLIVYDGLCKYKTINRLYKITGSDILVKSSEESLDIIRNADNLFKKADEVDPWQHHVQTFNGFDNNRDEYFKIWVTDDIYRTEKQSGRSYKVARVEEYQTKRKKGKRVKTDILKERYWVITTKKDLTGIDMRDIAIRRWAIENNGFKQMNLFAHTKRLYSHDKGTALYLVLLLALAHNLFLLFLSTLSKNEELQNEIKRRPLKYWYLTLANNTFITGGHSPPGLF